MGEDDSVSAGLKGLSVYENSINYSGGVVGLVSYKRFKNTAVVVGPVSSSGIRRSQNEVS